MQRAEISKLPGATDRIVSLLNFKSLFSDMRYAIGSSLDVLKGLNWCSQVNLILCVDFSRLRRRWVLPIDLAGTLDLTRGFLMASKFDRNDAKDK
jgi:hypothetical protein